MIDSLSFFQQNDDALSNETAAATSSEVAASSDAAFTSTTPTFPLLEELLSVPENNRDQDEMLQGDLVIDVGEPDRKGGDENAAKGDEVPVDLTLNSPSASRFDFSGPFISSPSIPATPICSMPSTITSSKKMSPLRGTLRLPVVPAPVPQVLSRGSGRSRGRSTRPTSFARGKGGVGSRLPCHSLVHERLARARAFNMTHSTSPSLSNLANFVGSNRAPGSSTTNGNFFTQTPPSPFQNSAQIPTPHSVLEPTGEQLNNYFYHQIWKNINYEKFVTHKMDQNTLWGNLLHNAKILPQHFSQGELNNFIRHLTLHPMQEQVAAQNISMLIHRSIIHLSSLLQLIPPHGEGFARNLQTRLKFCGVTHNIINLIGYMVNLMHGCSVPESFVMNPANLNTPPTAKPNIFNRNQAQTPYKNFSVPPPNLHQTPAPNPHLSAQNLNTLCTAAAAVAAADAAAASTSSHQLFNNP